MSDTNETIADIIAEMRFHGQLNIDAEQDKPEFGVLTVEGKIIKSYADRIEAAYRREIEATAAKCCQLGRLAGYGASEIKHQQEPVGDVAKLREAVGKILWCLEWMFNNTDDKSVQSHLGEPIALAKSALAEPPRNCDVGTVEEQAARMRAFCAKNGLCRDGAYRCENCGLLHEFRCELTWAQMPYEEGGAK